MSTIMQYNACMHAIIFSGGVVKKIFSSNWFFICCFTILAGTLCFWGLTRNSLTFDEVTSILIAKNWQSMLPILWTKEGNMWLYFVILHFWMKFGTSVIFVRSLSALIGTLTIPIFYLLAKEVKNEKIARIATPLFMCSVYFIFYAQLARSYGLSLLLVTLSSYLFLKLVKNSFSGFLLFLYILVSVMAAYTHLLAIFALVTPYIYLITFPGQIPWKKIFFIGTGIFIGILPLFLSPAVRSGHQLDWLRVHPFVFLPFGIITLAGDSLPLTIIGGLIILNLFWKKRQVFLQKNRERFILLWLFLWAGFPIVFTFFFSVFIKPIYQPQYFNACLSAYILLVVLGLEELKNKKILYYFLLGFLFFLSFVRLFQWYTGENHYLTDYVILENNFPDDWRDTAKYVLKQGKSTDAVIFYAYYVHEPFEYYYSMKAGNNHPKILEISSGSYDLGGGTKIPEPNFSLLSSLSKNYSRVWLVLENNNTTELGKKTQWLEIEKVMHKDYTLSYDKFFNKVEVQLFERK